MAALRPGAQQNPRTVQEDLMAASEFVLAPQDPLGDEG